MENFIRTNRGKQMESNLWSVIYKKDIKVLARAFLIGIAFATVVFAIVFIIGSLIGFSS